MIVLNVTPPDNIGDKYRQLRYEELSLRAIVEGGGAEFILARPNHPYYMQMLQFVTERAHGKVAQEVRQKMEFMPAVALPAKEPEQIPDGYMEVIPPAPAVAGLLLPPKTDGSTDHLDPAAGATDNLPNSE